MFATCGYDHTVNLWDLGLDRKDPSQKRLFVHKGHRSKVVDFDWNPHNRFLLGSTEENNCIHIWEMMRSIYFDEQKTV
jgi:histone-binding protein RBBP4